MDKITEALKKVLPAEHVAEVAKAVEEAMAANYQELQDEFHEKLENAYEQLAEERKNDEQIAEEGYRQAYEIIASLMNRIDEQREEFERALDEGFEEAYQELQKERSKNSNIEVNLYDEFNAKLQEMKAIMIDKVDQFMDFQESVIYEAAKKDVLSDPRILEQRVAVEKMAEILSDYISADTVAGANTGKLEEMAREVENLRGQLRIVEARNVNLSVKNKKLDEQVREAHTLITEATKVERKDRANRRGIASGRGQRVMNEELINEFVAPTNHSSQRTRDLREDHDPLNDLAVLAGL